MRTGSFAARTLAAMALAVVGQTAQALEFGLEGLTSNLQLPWTPVTPLTVSQFPSTNYFWGGEAWLRTPLGEDAAIRLSYDRDPVLRNTAIAAVQFDRGIARISVGPLIGLFNSDSAPLSAGISASVKLQWPGVAYVSLRSDGGTAISVLQTASNPQARTELAAGFYVPNAIVSGLISAKSFNEVDSSGGLVTDTLTRYALTVDVFKKNVPYTALLSLGYELRSKHYATENTTDSLGAIVMGIDTTAQISHALTLLGGISTGAYVFGLDSLKDRGPGNSSFLFTATLGLSVDTSAIKILPKQPAEQAETPSGKEAEAPAPSEMKAAIFDFDVGGGLYYDAYPMTGGFDILQLLRGGAWVDAMHPLEGGFSLGGEVGAFYMADPQSSRSFIDLPLRIKGSYRRGNLDLQGFGGLFTADSPSAIAFGFGIEAGARVMLGPFYAEGSYVFGLGGLAGFPRFGLGYSVPISLKRK